MQTYKSYENQYNHAVKFGSKVIYYVEEIEALQAREAIADGKIPQPPQFQRLLPFGQGIEFKDGKFRCFFDGEHLGDFDTLRPALKMWDEREQEARFRKQEDDDMAAIDSRYYDGLTYDEDGYKVFKPKPSGGTLLQTVISHKRSESDDIADSFAITSLVSIL